MTRKRKDRERRAVPPAGAAGTTSTGPVDSGGSPGPGQNGQVVAEPRTLFDTIRENAEAFIVAVILAFIIRHFVIEAFEIPTGSMADTLFGLHSWTTCPNCSTEYAVALKSDQSTGQVNVQYSTHRIYKGSCGKSECGLKLHVADGSGGSGILTCSACKTTFRGNSDGFREVPAKIARARCPICHLVVDRTVFLKSNKWGGDKILVTKFAYVFGKPRRWDVIVFEFDQWKNYIKRLVGLPGEMINIWDGDIYVNGKVERKHARPRGNDRLWTKLSDTDVVEAGLNAPAWAEVAPARSGRVMTPHKNAAWNPAVRRWSLNALGDVTVLEYRRGFDNYYSYNLFSDSGSGGIQGYPPEVQVGDKKVSFVARIEAPPPPPPGVEQAGSWIGAEIRDGDFTFQLRLPVGSSGARRDAILERMSNEEGNLPSPLRPAHVSGLRDTAPFTFRPGVPVAVEFENLDDRAAVRIDGEEVLSLEYTSLPEGTDLSIRTATPGEMKDGHYIRIMAVNAQADLESITVHRDIYYIARMGNHWPGKRLGPHEYFALGDNGPSSSDGRAWGSVPEKNLMGQAFVVFWPGLPHNFRWRFIR